LSNGFSALSKFFNTFCSTEQFLATEISNTFYFISDIMLFNAYFKTEQKVFKLSKVFKSLCSTEQPELSEKNVDSKI